MVARPLPHRRPNMAALLQAALACAAAAAGTHPTPPAAFDVGRHCDVTSFGAAGDNRTDCTRAFRAAVAACGTVHVPPGTFRTAAFNLTSNQLLSLADGATLVAQPDARLYPVVLGLPPMGSAGRAKVAPCALVSAYFATNVSVVGAGRGKSVIDGLGWQWWQNYSWVGHHYSMISLVQTYKCRGVTVANLTLQNSPTWTLHPFGSDGVHIHGLAVLGQRSIGQVEVGAGSVVHNPGLAYMCVCMRTHMCAHVCVCVCVRARARVRVRVRVRVVRACACARVRSAHPTHRVVVLPAASAGSTRTRPATC